jgi:predicted enzyme related to lactoylglutathione lyase
MKITEIAFTIVPVRSLKVSRAFYEGVLGLVATNAWVEGDQGMVEYDIGAGTLAIGAGAPMMAPSPVGLGVALEVDDFDKAIAELKAANATFSLDRHETSVCFMAVVDDPDGNKLTFHRRKSG